MQSAAACAAAGAHAVRAGAVEGAEGHASTRLDPDGAQPLSVRIACCRTTPLYFRSPGHIRAYARTRLMKQMSSRHLGRSAAVGNDVGSSDCRNADYSRWPHIVRLFLRSQSLFCQTWAACYSPAMAKAFLAAALSCCNTLSMPQVCVPIYADANPGFRDGHAVPKAAHGL